MQLPARSSLASALFVLALLLPATAHSQGCSQCRETIGQTPAKTQTAYRRAIVLLVVAGGGVFGAALVALKRFR